MDAYDAVASSGKSEDEDDLSYGNRLCGTSSKDRYEKPTETTVMNRAACSEDAREAARRRILRAFLTPTPQPLQTLPERLSNDKIQAADGPGLYNAGGDIMRGFGIVNSI